MGLDDEEIELEQHSVKSVKKLKKPYAVWSLGGKDFRLKLTTAVICQIENKLGGNLLNVITGGNIPSLGVMLTIVQGALQAYEHGIKYTKVQEMFDTYRSEGGTQISLVEDVLMPLYEVSGFFPPEDLAEPDLTEE